MKPLILEYSEESKATLNTSLIEYDKNLNLSVDKKTKEVAIDYLNMSTETFTKTFSEVSDSDNDRMKILMGTITQTHADMESSDDDYNRINTLKVLMGTRTLTESQETSDSDN